VWKRLVRVDVIEVRRSCICGGRVPGGREVRSSCGGGSFSLFVEWLEVVLVWEEVEPAVVWMVKEGRGAGVDGMGKSSCTI
jgi:hypothetical protein